MSRPKFSLLTILLVTAVIALGISHFNVSRQNAELQKALIELRGQVGLLHTTDDHRIYATALPNYGELQWRWRIQLPAEGKYQLCYRIAGDIPESGFPEGAAVDDTVFLDSQRTPIPGGEPFVLAIVLFQKDGRWWMRTDANSGRSSAWPIRAPSSWLDEDQSGWGTSISGKQRTVSVASSERLKLLSYRRSKRLPNGAITVDMEPTDGMVFWLERQAD